MKKAWMIIGIVFALALLISGAKFLYDNLDLGKSAQLQTPAGDINGDQVSQSTPADTNDAQTSQNTPTTDANDEQITTENTAAATEQPQRQLPPNFTAYDAQGNAVQLSDMRGKPVIVNFWASWCDPCKGEMPDFEEAYKTYGEEVIFMMVNLTDGQRETQATAQAHIDKNKFTFPVYFDLDQSGASAYRTVSIPATYFFDADGYLVTYAVGMLDAATLEVGIGMLLD